MAINQIFLRNCMVLMIIISISSSYKFNYHQCIEQEGFEVMRVEGNGHECQRCDKGTFNDGTFMTCQKCRICEHVVQNCTSKADTKCQGDEDNTSLNVIDDKMTKDNLFQIRLLSKLSLKYLTDILLFIESLLKLDEEKKNIIFSLLFSFVQMEKEKLKDVEDITRNKDENITDQNKDENITDQNLQPKDNKCNCGQPSYLPTISYVLNGILSLCCVILCWKIFYERIKGFWRYLTGLNECVRYTKPTESAEGPKTQPTGSTEGCSSTTASTPDYCEQVYHVYQGPNEAQNSLTTGNLKKFEEKKKLLDKAAGAYDIEKEGIQVTELDKPENYHEL